MIIYLLKGPCDPATHRGCDRSLNQVCIVKNNKFVCGCPPGFEKHPITQVSILTANVLILIFLI